jgi:hypothetical protein
MVSGVHISIVEGDDGCVAAVLDEDGEIVATAADSWSDGAYMIIDEVAFWDASGQLLPPPQDRRR